MDTMENTTNGRAVGSRAGSSKRVRVAAAITALAVPLALNAQVHADTSNGADPAPILREWNEDGTAAPGDEKVGMSVLRRSADGLHAVVQARGLEPGGVYTFWWVVVQDDGDFPSDIHVQQGAGVVVGNSGNTVVKMNAATGDAGITGFPPLGGALFADLTDPLDSLVRIEVAYHGQAADAGGDLDVWLSDFWSGSACPPETPNPNPMQPHCPVYDAATHTP